MTDWVESGRGSANCVRACVFFFFFFIWRGAIVIYKSTGNLGVSEKGRKRKRGKGPGVLELA